MGDENTATLKTTGKVAATPSGSGTGQVKPPAAKSSVAAPKVVPTKGRGPVAATHSRKSGGGTASKSGGGRRGK